MNNSENINWREIVAAFSSYEGTSVNFCNANHISKSQLYYYRNKFEKEDNIKFHAISIKEERVKTEITVIPTDRSNIRIEIGVAKIYIPANEIAVLSSLLKDLMTNV